MVLTYDVIVIGLGAVGSATLRHLARRGLRVLGLDRFALPNVRGSSHGDSRIIRKAYFEGARYVGMLERSYTLWHDLEAEFGIRLLHATGGLMIGSAGSALVQGARHSAEVHGIEHEMIGRDEVRRRFPGFQLPEEHVALWEPGAGWLYPEYGLWATLESARRAGARMHYGEPVTGWNATSGAVTVRTASATYEAGALAVCAGGWIRSLLPDLPLPLEVERQVTGWFRPRSDAGLFAPERCPIYLWEYEPDHLLYGFPDLGQGLKAGLHHGGSVSAHPDQVGRAVTPEDEVTLRSVFTRLLPRAAGRLVHAATCFYTNTPDHDFLIDTHPMYPNVALASACSGHGFKTSIAVGEVVADLITGEPPGFDVAPFGLERMMV